MPGRELTAIAALQPDWPAPAGVRALCTLRGVRPVQGASHGPWAAFNLGDHVGDAAAAVAANRARLGATLRARPVFLRQVHGTRVAALAPGTPDGVEADGAITAEPGLACTVLVADCLPILLTDTAGRRVAAIHAGWRGLAAGVVEQAVARFLAPALDGQAQAAINIEASELLAWLGPCIGPSVFEVGGEVREAFVRVDAGARQCFEPRGGGKYLADLQALARQRLGRLGVTRIHGNDGSAQWCTVTQEQRYYSHRRDQRRLGGCGRMAACIWRV